MAFLTLTQVTTTQAQFLTTKSQAMTAQDIRKFAARVNPSEITISLRLKNFRRINPPIFFEYMVNEYCREYLEEVYNIVYATGVTSD